MTHLSIRRKDGRHRSYLKIHFIFTKHLKHLKWWDVYPWYKWTHSDFANFVYQLERNNIIMLVQMYKHNILLITIVVKHLFVKRFTKVIDLIYFNKSFQLSKDKCSCRIFETYDLIFTIQSINLRQDCKLRESYKLRLNLTVNQNIRKKKLQFRRRIRTKFNISVNRFVPNSQLNI